MHNSENQGNIANLGLNKQKYKIQTPSIGRQSRKSVSSFLNEFQVVESRMTDLNIEINQPLSPHMLSEQKQSHNCPSCFIWEKWALESEHSILSMETKLIEKEKQLQYKMKQIYANLMQKTNKLKAKQQQCLKLTLQNQQLKQIYSHQIREECFNKNKKIVYQIQSDFKYSQNDYQTQTEVQNSDKSLRNENMKQLSPTETIKNNIISQKQSQFKKKLRYNVGESRTYKEQKLYEPALSSSSNNSYQNNNNKQAKQSKKPNNQQVNKSQRTNFGVISKKQQKGSIKHLSDHQYTQQINQIQQNKRKQRQENILQQFDTQKSQTELSFLQNKIKTKEKLCVQFMNNQVLMSDVSNQNQINIQQKSQQQQKKQKYQNQDFAKHKQHKQKVSHKQNEQKQLKLGSIRNNLKNKKSQNQNSKQDKLDNNSCQKTKKQLQKENKNKSLQSKRQNNRHSIYNYDASYYMGKSEERKLKLGLHTSQSAQKIAIIPPNSYRANLKSLTQKQQPKILYQSLETKNSKSFEAFKNKMEGNQFIRHSPIMQNNIRYSFNQISHNAEDKYNYASASDNKKIKINSKFQNFSSQQPLMTIVQEKDNNTFDFSKKYNSISKNEINNKFIPQKRQYHKNFDFENNRNTNSDIKKNDRIESLIKHNIQNIKSQKDFPSEFKEKVNQKQKRSYKYTQQFKKEKQQTKNDIYQKNQHIRNNKIVNNQKKLDQRYIKYNSIHSQFEKSQQNNNEIQLFNQSFNKKPKEDNIQQQIVQQDQYSKEYVRNFIQAQLKKYNKQQCEKFKQSQQYVNQKQGTKNNSQNKMIISSNAQFVKQKQQQNNVKNSKTNDIQDRNMLIAPSQIQNSNFSPAFQYSKNGIYNQQIDVILSKPQQLQQWHHKLNRQQINQQLKQKQQKKLQNQNIMPQKFETISQIDSYKIQSSIKRNINKNSALQLIQTAKQPQIQQIVKLDDSLQKNKTREVIKTKLCEQQQKDEQQNNLILSKLSSNSSIKVIAIAQNQRFQKVQKQSKVYSQPSQQLTNKYMQQDNDKFSASPQNNRNSQIIEFNSMKILNKQYLNSDYDEQRDFKVKTQKHFQKISFSNLNLDNNDDDQIVNPNLSFYATNKVKYVSQQQQNTKKQYFNIIQKSRQNTQENESNPTNINIKIMGKNQNNDIENYKLNTQKLSKPNKAESQGQSTLKTIKLRNNPLNVQKSRVCEVNSDCSSLQNDTRYRMRNTNDERGSMMSEQFTRDPSVTRNPQLSQQYLEKASKDEQMISELERLKFQNQNLKSYNVVLLSKLGKNKPRKY